MYQIFFKDRIEKVERISLITFSFANSFLGSAGAFGNLAGSIKTKKNHLLRLSVGGLYSYLL